MAKNKKEKFQQKNSNNQIYMIAGALIVIIIGAVFFLTSGKDSANQANVTTGNTASTPGTQVQEVTVTPTVTADTLVIKKSDIEKNKIVKFDYEAVDLTLKSGAKVPFPLLAYVTPSGQVKVAIRMCEPCNGLSFSIIDGNILNCNVCGTQWNLETNEFNGVGAQYCGSYPPEILPNVTIDGDNVVIKISDFKDWVPRV